MAAFRHTHIDLEGPALRLVRLLRGTLSDSIQCEIFDAWLNESEGGLVPYEALSYTWGSTEDTADIMIKDCKMAVTENLHSALQHLRLEDTDRILWIDAICIDQNNLQERGHQVKQMGEIYRKAERVIIWLGQASDETDLAMDSMKQLHKEIIRIGGNWRHSGQTWVEAQLFKRIAFSGGVYTDWKDARSAQREGLQALLRRSWFRRIWVLQEVANARAALVVCGKRSVSAGIFALVPSILELPLDRHCQAVLDIMPGISRKESWWGQKRDLQTILKKFTESEASDPRDKIFALLGMSTDACESETLRADYTKSLREVIQETILFLTPYANADESLPTIPHSTLEVFLQNLDSLHSLVLWWAVQQGKEVLVQLILKRNDIDVNFIWIGPWAPLLLAAQTGNDIEVNPRDNDGRTPLSWAAEKGYVSIVKLLLERDDIELNSQGDNHRTPLSWAALEGHMSIVKLLLERDDIELNSQDDNYRTPLSWAALGGHVSVVELLLERDDIELNSQDNYGRTSLSWAALGGHVSVVKLLLERDDIELNSRENYGGAPLLWAAVHGHASVVELLLERDDIELNSRDKLGRIPLSWAAEHGHVSVVELLLERDDIELNYQDDNHRTPLSLAAEKGHASVVKLLLERDDIELNSQDDDRRTPLSWAAEKGHVSVVKLLLERGDIELDSQDNYGKTPLSRAIQRRHKRILGLLCKRIILSLVQRK